MRDTLLVTGGAGFIGSNFVLGCANCTPYSVLNLDLLTYAGNPANLAGLDGNGSYAFVRGDICDAELIGNLLREHRPRAVVHFAAESHVDRSIASPEAFIRTNVHRNLYAFGAGEGLLERAGRSGSGSVPIPACFH